MALANMKAEFTRSGITQKEVADFLGMSTNNFNLKINEKIPMTLDEFRDICTEFLPTVEVEYLLQTDADVPNKAESLHAQAEVAYEAALASEEISNEEAEELRGLLHECVDMANSK